jgi:hemerythrin-like metal-binding protein
MHRFDVTKDLATGNADIDARLQALFAIANQILFSSDIAEDAARFRRAVSLLVAHLESHFASEELAMSRHEYLGKRFHAGFHDHVRSAARDIVGRLAQDGQLDEARQAIFFLLEDWVVYHVTRGDRELAAHLREHAPALPPIVTLPAPDLSTDSRWLGTPAARAETT